MADTERLTIATAAMQAILQGNQIRIELIPGNADPGYGKLAKISFEIAEAMMKEYKHPSYRAR